MVWQKCSGIRRSYLVRAFIHAEYMEDHLCILMTHLIRYKSRISTCRQHPARVCMTQLIGASAADARSSYRNIP